MEKYEALVTTLIREGKTHKAVRVQCLLLSWEIAKVKYRWSIR